MSSEQPTVLLEAEGLQKAYRTGRSTLEVLRGVDLQILCGEILSIVGASGSGKSTLLHILGLLDEPDRGDVRFKGTSLIELDEAQKASYRCGNVGFIFQFYHLLPELTALENVLLPEMMRKTPKEFGQEEARLGKRAEELLDSVGLNGRSKHRPGELSGGERQRVAVARALMNEPEIVLCDEPTGNLDQATSAEVVELILHLNATTSQTFVIVTHDQSLAERAGRILRIDEGRLQAAELHEWVK